MADLINITAPQYRCSFGGCPAVYTDRTPERYRCGPIASSCPAVLDDDAGNFIFIGEHLGPVPGELAGKIGATEAAVRLSAELVLSSLGLPDLIEAAEQALEKINETGVLVSTDDEFAALREALTRIQGGK